LNGQTARIESQTASSVVVTAPANPATCRGDVVVRSGLGVTVAKNAFTIDFDPVPDCACGPLPGGFVAIRVRLYVVLLMPFGFAQTFRNELALLLHVFNYRFVVHHAEADGLVDFVIVPPFMPMEMAHRDGTAPLATDTAALSGPLNENAQHFGSGGNGADNNANAKATDNFDALASSTANVDARASADAVADVGAGPPTVLELFLALQNLIRKRDRALLAGLATRNIDLIRGITGTLLRLCGPEDYRETCATPKPDPNNTGDALPNGLFIGGGLGALFSVLVCLGVQWRQRRRAEFEDGEKQRLVMIST